MPICWPREAIVTPADGETPSPKPRSDAIFADFESGSYDGWKLEGEAFADKPAADTQPRQQTVSGWQGKFYVNTYPGDDGVQGKATSRPFKIERRYITMLVGGGAHAGQTCMNLVVNGKAARTITGKDNERLDPAFWDVADLAGQDAHLEIVDAHTGGWGHINLDQIVFTDNKPSSGEALRPTLAVPREHVAVIAAKHGLDADILAAWVEHLAVAKNDASDPLHLWASLSHESNADDSHVAAVAQRIVADTANRTQQMSEALNAAKIIIDYTRGDTSQLLTDGSAFGIATTPIGDALLSSDAAAPLSGFAAYGAARRDRAFVGLSLSQGTQNEVGGQGGWQRPEQTLRTPTFTIVDGPVHYLVRGAGRAFAVVDSHRMLGGPLHGETLMQWNDDAQGRLRWVTHNLQRQKGHRAHVEFTPLGNDEFEILLVAQGPQATGSPIDEFGTATLAKTFAGENARSLGDIAIAYRALLDDAVSVAGRGFPDEVDRQQQAALANWMVKHPAMFVSREANASEAGRQLADAAKQFADAQQQLAAQIKRTSRLARDVGWQRRKRIAARPRQAEQPRGEVPRRSLTALGGKGSLMPRRQQRPSCNSLVESSIRPTRSPRA